MPDARWKRRERAAAALLGTRRKPCSGSGGRADQTASDSMHERIFLETKSRKRHSVRTLYDQVKAKAQRERKLPVLALADFGRPGLLLVIHSDDMAKVAQEYLAAALPADVDPPPIDPTTHDPSPRAA
jgi:hypothetical protein